MTTVQAIPGVNIEMTWEANGNDYSLVGYLENVVIEEDDPYDSWDLLRMPTSKPDLTLSGKFVNRGGSLMVLKSTTQPVKKKVSKHYYA